MKNLLKKLKNLLNPKYSLVYTTKHGVTQMYTISRPQHRQEFGNVKEGLATAGFRAFCYNRAAIRSFRYDRIVALNRR